MFVPHFSASSSCAANVSYTWQDGSTNDNFSVSQPGKYWVSVNADGCLASDTIKIDYLSFNKIFPTNDTTLCLGNSIILNGGNPGANYLWNDNSHAQMLTVNQSGKYWVTVTTNGCSASDTIVCNFIAGPVINLGNDTTICEGQKLILHAGNNTALYLWNNNTTADSLLVLKYINFFGCSSFIFDSRFIVPGNS
ncbi:MAG TPA: hypothetical protein VMU83_10135 [Hanamia sp.]|nr:hypothetical protein [Hanamia sp.]